MKIARFLADWAVEGGTEGGEYKFLTVLQLDLATEPQRNSNDFGESWDEVDTLLNCKWG